MSINVCVKSLSDRGRAFPWPRPERCPRCGSCRVWGHGWVSAWFDGLTEAVWLRRWRCPECRLVIRMRPAGFWPRFQSSVADIRESLRQRLHRLRWPPHCGRARQRHWLQGLRRQLLAHLGADWTGTLLEAFDRLTALGIVAVSRSVVRDTSSLA